MQSDYRVYKLWRRLLDPRHHAWSFDRSNHDNVATTNGNGWRAKIWSRRSGDVADLSGYDSAAIFIAECRAMTHPHGLEIFIDNYDRVLSMRCHGQVLDPFIFVQGEWETLLGGRSYRVDNRRGTSKAQARRLRIMPSHLWDPDLSERLASAGFS